MDDQSILLEIKKLYEKYIIKNVDDFCVDDYNNFEKEVWILKDKYSLEDSPFLLLPDPAEEADRFMMNASNDGLVEPKREDKIEYLKKMKVSYSRL
ncbi:MAG: hypothetical protein Q4B29_01610 [Candidatus Saccharibacteria bacterium]|nr:hypothetical protein [Candidatus Saccharibacteria bacterium]